MTRRLEPYNEVVDVVDVISRHSNLIARYSPNFCSRNLTTLPSFKYINGDFWCIDNKLTTLDRNNYCYVSGYFYCGMNSNRLRPPHTLIIGKQFDNIV